MCIIASQNSLSSLMRLSKTRISDVDGKNTQDQAKTGKLKKIVDLLVNDTLWKPLQDIGCKPCLLKAPSDLPTTILFLLQLVH